MKKLLLVLIVLVITLKTAFAADELSGLLHHPQPNQETPFFNANKAALVTTISFSVLTAASAIGAAAAARTANTFNLVSYSVLALIGAGVSIAGITAWWSFGDEQSTTDAGTYFEKVGEHSAYAITGAVVLTAQVLVQSVIQGLAQGTSRAISRSIGGEDRTIRIIR